MIVNVPLCHDIDGSDDGSTCPQVATYDVLDGINEQSLLDSELSYQFRDEFMVQYQFTQNYITYYYSIGEIVYDNLTLSLAIQTATTFADFTSCMDMLLDPTTYANDILIDTNMKTELISLVNAYQTLSTDTDYQTTLTTIESDINTLANKTVQEVIDSF